MDETNSNITWDTAADAASRAKVASLVQSVQDTLAQEQQTAQQIQEEQVPLEQKLTGWDYEAYKVCSGNYIFILTHIFSGVYLLGSRQVAFLQ